MFVPMQENGSWCTCLHLFEQSFSQQAKLRPPIIEGHTDVLVFLLLSFILFLFNWALRIFFVEPVAAQLLGKWSTRAKVQKFAQVPTKSATVHLLLVTSSFPRFCIAFVLNIAPAYVQPLTTHNRAHLRCFFISPSQVLVP